MPGNEVKEGQGTKKMPSRKQNVRPTIGLLIGETSDPVSWAVWRGVHDTTQERDVNLICFVGGSLRPTLFDLDLEVDTQANVLYDLVSPENVDGLVIWSGGIGQYASPEEIGAFCEQYHPIPIVSVAVSLERVPSVLVDNYTGMYDVILHLIEVHGYRHIAFIRGPEGHPEAEERYRAYVEALAEHDIPFDPDLVAIGAFERELGAEAVTLLLDERKVDFEVIAAADDDSAFGAMNALQVRGLGVPNDIAVVGFDDTEESLYTLPPLTTVSSPVYEQGRRATEMVLALLKGEQVPERVCLPTRPVVRRSCGCPSPEMVWASAHAIAEPMTVPTTGTAAEMPNGHTLAAQREEILSEMVRAAEGATADLAPGWVEQLLEGFVAELEADSPSGSVDSAESGRRGQLAGSHVFLPTLNRLLNQVAAVQGDMAPWQNVLSTLRRRTLPHLSDKAQTWAEDLWHRGRVLIWEAERRASAHRRTDAELEATLSSETATALTSAIGMANLMDVAAQTLQQLEIPSCYLSLYEDPTAPTERSRLILAYDEDGHVQLETDGQRFPSHQLIPGGTRRNRRYSLVAKALYLQEAQLGFVLLEVGPQNWPVYEVLGVQLSSALQRALLIERMERRALRLQTAAEVSRAASSILDPDDLIQQAVDLVGERFGLYYAGLFLVDKTGEWTRDRTGRVEPGRWAVLRAGTSEAGQKMLDQGHKLEIGGESMIGSCVATRTARVALDVDKEATHFRNPFLPETRSELALPLISRGEVIGALTIQSAQEAAFSEKDITVLQIMADQLANAIANARLFEQTQAALEETETIQRRYLQQAWTEYMRTQKVSGYEQIGAILMPLGDEPPAGARQAMLERRPVIWNDDSGAGSSVLIVPIMLRDRPLGVLGFRAEERQQWEDEDIALAEAISQQFSQAAETLRLLDETQNRAAREQWTSEIATRIRETLDVDTVLQTAVHAMRQVLGLHDIAIRLGDANGAAATPTDLGESERPRPDRQTEQDEEVLP